MRWSEIARLTGILPYTCQKIVKDFHLKGNSLEVKKKTGTNIQPLPDDVKQYLKESLRENQFMSLRERMHIIHQKFDFPITLYRLWSNYHRMGISFRPS